MMVEGFPKFLFNPKTIPLTPALPKRRTAPKGAREREPISLLFETGVRLGISGRCSEASPYQSPLPPGEG